MRSINSWFSFSFNHFLLLFVVYYALGFIELCIVFFLFSLPVTVLCILVVFFYSFACWAGQQQPAMVTHGQSPQVAMAPTSSLLHPSTSNSSRPLTTPVSPVPKAPKSPSKSSASPSTFPSKPIRPAPHWPTDEELLKDDDEEVKSLNFYSSCKRTKYFLSDSVCSRLFTCSDFFFLLLSSVPPAAWFTLHYPPLSLPSLFCYFYACLSNVPVKRKLVCCVSFVLHSQGVSGEVSNDDSDLWRIDGTTTTILSRSGSRLGQGELQVPPPVLPKLRRDSGLPILESRPSFSRVQVFIVFLDSNLILPFPLGDGRMRGTIACNFISFIHSRFFIYLFVVIFLRLLLSALSLFLHVFSRTTRLSIARHVKTASVRIPPSSR